ncbi:MAG: hypothetical protein JMDDDDMK_00458 [Acidobacteria bacterium]|nr:hypothetical protein [Acidobacteriota bacterium]
MGELPSQARWKRCAPGIFRGKSDDETDDQINSNGDQQFDPQSEIRRRVVADAGDDLESGRDSRRRSLGSKPSLVQNFLEISEARESCFPGADDDRLGAAAGRAAAVPDDLHRQLLAARRSHRAVSTDDQQRRDRRHAQSHKRLRQAQRRERSFAHLLSQRQSFAAGPNSFASGQQHDPGHAGRPCALLRHDHHHRQSGFARRVSVERNAGADLGRHADRDGNELDSGTDHRLVWRRDHG